MPEACPIVLVSQDWEGDESTPAGPVYRVWVAESSVWVANVSAIDGPPSKCELPSSKFTLFSVGGDHDDGWVATVAWLQAKVGEEALFVVDYDHPLRELMLLGAASLGLQYCLRFTEAPKRFSAPLEFAIIGNAQAMLFAEPSLEDEFRTNYFAPYAAATTLHELREATQLGQRSMSRPPTSVWGDRSVPAPSADKSVVRVLIVAYFSGPCRTVGVQRPNYWFEELANLSEGVLDVHLATATAWGESREGIHVVPDLHTASLLDGDNRFPAWAADFVANERQDATSFNTLSFYWRYALEKHFDTAEQTYDVVVISGNPFSCFDFAAYAKRRWHARVVLDYRDPFANNPRFLYSREEREAVRYAERGLNFQADAISVVNEHCAGLVEGGSGAEIVILPNGFDERVLDSVNRVPLSPDKTNFVHAGSFYHYGTPAHLIAALDPDRHTFHHIGNAGGVDAELLNAEPVVTHGTLPYESSLGVVGGADIGVVFLSEQNFETTTKLFDYLAMDIDILLCTNGKPGMGALAEILEDQEGVYWCENTPEGTTRFVEEYQNDRDRSRPRSSRFSRRHTAEQLVALILDLARN